MPYALYIHGLGSGGSSPTVNTMYHYMPHFEWLHPELPIDPDAALAVLQNHIEVFEPLLVVGTSLGGFFGRFLKAEIKVAINPTFHIARTLRRVGYGRHEFICNEREDGATHYSIDEPLVQRYVHLHENTPIPPQRHSLAIFSQDDELLGRELSKSNAVQFEAEGYQLLWTNRCGHRPNQACIKLLAQWVGQFAPPPKFVS